jgi:hypothetical protein
MSSQNMADVTLAADGGVFTDAAGQTQFIKGYGTGKNKRLDLDPRINLTQPIWEQVQRLAQQDSDVEHEA